MTRANQPFPSSQARRSRAYSLPSAIFSTRSLPASRTMLSFDNDDGGTQPARLYRAASTGSWGVTSIGRGFTWDENESEHHPNPSIQRANTSQPLFFDSTSDELAIRNELPSSNEPPKITRLVTNVTSNVSPNSKSPMLAPAAEPYCCSPTKSRSPSPRIPPPQYRRSSLMMSSPSTPGTPRPRRRSSQQRVSLVAGRVLIAPTPMPGEDATLPPKNLCRADSESSLLSLATSTRAPSPSRDSFLGNRSISDFQIDGEIGRGAYGLVKRAREIQPDGSLGPLVVIKQIIKSRILADCWKKHPKLGTIPIEIYVMSSISNTSYVLPPRRPWDHSRLRGTGFSPEIDGDEWVEGKVIKGHPNICPLNDFFEDNHYYYLVLPSSTPVPLPGEPIPPSDLFDLVESYPQGLPPSSIRTYLGQIADGLYFLHSHGIVHRDIKDENVVLGADGRCILIDFGSSGLVRKTGWDTFSGTLDYAGPEILRGERYYGKEQDVWAFGVVAYVLLVGECPFMTAAEAQEGLDSPFANASISLDERCAEGKEEEGEEADGGGALGDAAALVRACLHVKVSARPTFEQILQCRFLAGDGGWTQFGQDQIMTN